MTSASPAVGGVGASPAESEWMPPEYDVLIGTVRAGELLERDRRSAAQLAAAGLLGRTYREEAGPLLVEKSVVDALVRSRRPVELTEPAFVARVGSPQADTGPGARTWVGFHTSMPPAVAEAAICGWYRVADRQIALLRGRPLLATVSGLCVLARRIIDAEQADGWVRWVVQRESNLEEQVGRWLTTGRGGPWTLYDPAARRG